ncbi:MAG: hypothetical protein WCO55_00920 [Candidatus Falkowbacteria bacterium]
MRQKFLWALGIVIVFGIGSIVRLPSVEAQATQPLYGGYPFVAVYDLRQAGFVNTEIKTPSDTMPSPAPLYFKVKESSGGSNEVMVYHYTSPYAFGSLDGLYSYTVNSQAYFIDGGFGKETQLADRRTVLSFVKGYDYVVIIGPDNTKVEKLAVALAKKIK